MLSLFQITLPHDVNSNGTKLEPFDTPAYHMVFRNTSVQKYVHYIKTLLFISKSLSIMWFLCRFTDKSVSSNDFYLIWVYSWEAFGVYQAFTTMIVSTSGNIRGRIFEACQSKRTGLWKPAGKQLKTSSLQLGSMTGLTWQIFVGKFGIRSFRSQNFLVVCLSF